MSFADELRNVSSASPQKREGDAFRSFIRSSGVGNVLCSKIQTACRMEAKNGKRSVRVEACYFTHMYPSVNFTYNPKVGGFFSKLTLHGVILNEELAPQLKAYCDQLGLLYKGVGSFYDSGGSDAPSSYIIFVCVEW